VEAQPVEHPLEVVPDGVRAQPHPLGDVGVGETFRRQERHLRLPAPQAEADAQLLGGRQPRRHPVQQDEHGGLREQAPRCRAARHQPVAPTGQLQLAILLSRGHSRHGRPSRQPADVLEQPAALGLLPQELVPAGVARRLEDPVAPEDRHPGVHLVECTAERPPPAPKALELGEAGRERAAEGHHRQV
jgi:hypothetical protein